MGIYHDRMLEQGSFILQNRNTSATIEKLTRITELCSLWIDVKEKCTKLSNMKTNEETRVVLLSGIIQMIF